MALNKIVLMGRMTERPELRYTGQGTPVASFTLAVDRDYQRDETDFISCVAWRKTGEFVHNYFDRGSLAVVLGSLQNRKWEDKNGNKRTSAEIIVDQVYFGGSKKEQGKPAELVTATDFVDCDDGELPF